ncbi:pelargonidin 3-O-(6-caffeoylglucoside) 5-O-(6-O-malonylglucoside) 4'''-malonyltransferase-like [Salvia miltiorrhiza]|uniref:pelargonidin 3-O-(6-caffeoylglucoside) 5-O-(6-O-malonylglucoside) 4'''-malonyltransferase-like n=1 Tax=Salvia miltiorrhiza TaxID=226208 RepID=UPI0025ABFA03|nr:pelargonidin 3-O-(6-caffeoylglucoside) 5-O-(6-O-malonylglucoside) 4'''-malonyltransferase-like [Salvia miltiorrhiza]
MYFHKKHQKMQIHVVSRKLVKPSKATPPQLRSYKISVMDEVNPSMFVVRILYYRSRGLINLSGLEESLGRTLTRFYPLAGRYDKEKRMVECNDEGALYSTARVDCQLSRLIDGEVDVEQLNLLLPLEIGAADEPTDPMLAIQINRFQCGGTAVAVCASHRIFDAGSMSIFLTAWGRGGAAITPVFDSASYFPSENLPPLQTHDSRTRNNNISVRRFIFTKTALSELRRRMPASAKPPSRVAAASAALIQALLRADRAKHGESRPCIVAQAINVRGRTHPPVPDHSCGNWATFATLELDAGRSREMEADFPGLVSEMRGAAAGGVADCARLLADREFGRWALVGSYVAADERGGGGECKVAWISDWSKFGDYEVDLGLGKPDWVSLAGGRLEDIIVLMNTKDKEGIEAWVSLKESEMRLLEEDHQIRMLTCRRGLSKI